VWHCHSVKLMMTGSFISTKSTASLAALRSQACLSEASTKVGDHLGSPRDELFFCFASLLTSIFTA
jgi:hypothetical protein